MLKETVCPACVLTNDQIEVELRLCAKHVSQTADRGCPCLYVDPCHPQCTCVRPTSSRGCERCCRYGEPYQRRKRAELIAQGVTAMSGEETYKEVLLLYRHRLRGVLWQVGVASNPGVTDDWLIQRIIEEVTRDR